MTPQTREAAEGDAYFLSLKREFGYLSRKFGLEPMSRQAWRFLRARLHAALFPKTYIPRELGAWMGANGHTLVFGGCNLGLMECVAEAVHNTKGMTIASDRATFSVSSKPARQYAL